MTGLKTSPNLNAELKIISLAWLTCWVFNKIAQKTSITTLNVNEKKNGGEGFSTTTLTSASDDSVVKSRNDDLNDNDTEEQEAVRDILAEAGLENNDTLNSEQRDEE